MRDGCAGPGATSVVRNQSGQSTGTGWQQHSVRGFLAGVVRKRLKLKLSSKKVDGNRVYQIGGTDRGKVAPRLSKRRSR